MDDVARELVLAVPGSVWIRPQGEGVVVVCGDTKRVLKMLQDAVKELMTPKGETLQ